MSGIATALVGCGRAGEIHALALDALPESRFRAVCDSDIGRARAVADRFDVRAYSDVTEMVASEQVEAVCIATPHPVHAAPAVAAIEAGAHTLVEKPLAASLADCDAMLVAARASGISLGVVSQRRLYEPVQRMKQAIDAGKIGTPSLGVVSVLGWRSDDYYAMDPWRGTWEGEGGGVLVNQALHQLDLLQWFMGPIAEVSGHWSNINHPSIEVDDTAVAVVRFATGGMASIVASNSQKPGLHAKVHIHGDNGASIGVQTDGGAMFIAGVSDILDAPFNDLWTVLGEESEMDRWREEDKTAFESVDPMLHYHRLQIRDFLRSVSAGREPMVTGFDARRTVELFTAIYRSQKTGGPVAFPVVS